MRELVQTVVYGLTIGSVYALVACGYSLIFSTTRIVNFAQGPLVVVGGYLAWWLYSDVAEGDVSLLLVTLAAVILTAGVGVLVDLIAVAPLGRFDPTTNISWLVTTFAAGIVAQELVAKTISDTGQTLPPLVESIFGWRGSVVADVAIQPADVVLVGTTLAAVGGLALLQARTRIGSAFRAVAQDRQASSLMGINPRTIVMLSFALAGALAGLSAVLIAPRLGVRFNIALNLGVLGFVAAVLGGLGSIKGAVIGGYAVGFVDGLVGSLTSNAAAWQPIVVFAVFVIVLALRPTGLLGRPQVEKV
jgi:branched-chain amino acid transport system permease protein